MVEKQDPQITYFILFPKDTEQDCDKDTNQLGIIYSRKKYDANKTGFHREFVFQSALGFKILKQLINRQDPRAELIRIISSTSRKETIESFLEKVQGCAKIIEG
jgi:hypothetical protein